MEGRQHGYKLLVVPVLWCMGTWVMSLCVLMAVWWALASEMSWKVMLR